MFERYTEKARRIIFFARYEASQLGSHIIKPEHLLLGLLREAKTLFENAKIEPMREEIRAAARVEGVAVSTSVDLPLSHPEKKVLGYGAEEAERLNHRHIGPEHLLLGLMREPGLAATILEKYGVQRKQITESEPKSRGIVMQRKEVVASETKSREIVMELRWALAPLVERLTPEVEPAVVYTTRP
jgi:ATP-dependent Clp protease ATP-binding subunit ClpC